MLTARRLIEMKYGRDVLLHRLGEDDSYSLKQLPNLKALNDLGGSDEKTDSARLGIALAESFLTLLRRSQCDLGDMVGLPEYVGALPGPAARLCFLAHIETALLIALNHPESLPVVAARLDSLDNASLEKQAMAALAGESVGKDADGFPVFFGDDGGVFAGLQDGGAL